MPATDFAAPLDVTPTAPANPERPWIERFEQGLVAAARAAGFARDQQSYAQHYAAYFAELEALDVHLDTQRYLLGGEQPGAADEALALLLWMHDAVYLPLYKLNRQRLEAFSNLAHYLRDVFAACALAERVDLDRLKRDAYLESEEINPKRRIALGEPDPGVAHDRALRFEPCDGESDIEENLGKRARNGEWRRKHSGHRHFITADGRSGFPAARGRYHLYVANNCPWCHRAVLARSLMGLEDVISMDVLYYRRDPERGWQFRADEPGCTAESLFGYTSIREVYDHAGSTETSVPVLWDRETGTIVSNESAEIVRMFETEFGAFTDAAPDLYPASLRTQIDRVNTFTYHAINNGAYKAGFADSQAAYEAAYGTFFAAIDLLDQMLRGRRFLLGDAMTEADLRLFPTIFRFDPVYHIRFHLNDRMVRDVPSLSRWLETMLAVPAIARACNLDHCRAGYFGRTGNGVVPPVPR